MTSGCDSSRPIWGVVYSDGELTEAENRLARRIAELLGFQHPEVQAAKDRVAARAEGSAGTDEPSLLKPLRGHSSLKTSRLSPEIASLTADQ